jgi:CrcB protein
MEFAETAALTAADDSSPRARPGGRFLHRLDLLAAQAGDQVIMLYIALGGALGAAARYALGTWIHTWAGHGFPWGTFAINALGSFALGLSVRYLEGIVAAPELRALMTVGILGAFTTFSTFTYETIVLLQEGAWPRAAAYALGSLAIGLLAIASGLYLGARVLQTAV